MKGHLAGSAVFFVVVVFHVTLDQEFKLHFGHWAYLKKQNKTHTNENISLPNLTP